MDGGASRRIGRRCWFSYLVGMLAVIAKGFDLGEQDDGYEGAQSEEG